MKNAYVSNLTLVSPPVQNMNGNGGFDVTFKFDIVHSSTSQMVIGTKTITTMIPNSTTLDQLYPSCYKMAMDFVNAMINA
jgi:hypothetical protein